MKNEIIEGILTDYPIYECEFKMEFFQRLTDVMVDGKYKPVFQIFYRKKVNFWHFISFQIFNEWKNFGELRDDYDETVTLFIKLQSA